MSREDRGLHTNPQLRIPGASHVQAGPHRALSDPVPHWAHGQPTQMRSCARTTFPFRQARCSAVRPSTSPHVSFTSSREPCASSRMTARRSSSAVALSRCWPRDSSVHGSGARKSFCSYLARIQRSFSSLQEPSDRHGHNQVGQLRLQPLCSTTLWPGGIKEDAEQQETSVFSGRGSLWGKPPLWFTKWGPGSSIATTWQPVRNAGSQAPESEPPGCFNESCRGF